MTTQSNDVGGSPTGASASTIKRLFKETERLEQKARIGGMNLQCSLCAGQTAWQQAKLAHDDLPPGVRIDLPSAKVFARILGLLRCIAALEYRPMLEIELSAQDIADALGYGKTTVEAALRWLSGDVIEYRGMPVARGLGLISRVRRKAMAVVDGIYKKVYRTSELALTLMGRLLVGLVALAERRKKMAKPPPHKGAKGKKKCPQRPPPSPFSSEPSQQVDDPSDNREAALAWLSKLTAGDYTSL